MQLKNSLADRIKRLHFKKKMQKILTKESELQEYLAMRQEYASGDDDSDRSSNSDYSVKSIPRSHIDEESDDVSGESDRPGTGGLVSPDVFIQAVSHQMAKDRKRRMTLTDSKQIEISTKKHHRTTQRNDQLQELLTKDQVIVFPRKILQPWDDIPRFDFLDCNLRNIVNDDDAYQKKKKPKKDTFIGNINQLKP